MTGPLSLLKRLKKSWPPPNPASLCVLMPNLGQTKNSLAMNIPYIKAANLLATQACAKLYGGTGGSGKGQTTPTNGGSTTTPTGHVRPKSPSPDPDPDF